MMVSTTAGGRSLKSAASHSEAALEGSKYLDEGAVSLRRKVLSQGEAPGRGCCEAEF